VAFFIGDLMSDSVDNINGMQTIIDNIYTQLISVQSQKAAVLVLINNLGNNQDATAISNSGGAGGDSVSFLSLTQRLKMLVETENSLTETLLKTMELQNIRFPWVRRSNSL
jgi:hypothetical protein